MAEESSGINGFAWFLAGLGIGALAGILYAPKSGRETREDLANTARESGEYLRNRGKQVAEQVGTMVDRGREQVGEYMDRGREVVERGRAQWEEFVERGKNLVGDQTSRVSAAVDAGRQAYRATSAPGAGSGVTSGNFGSGVSGGSGAFGPGTPHPTTGESGV
ncbi:MAG TPA: YtxH domain-containing protein [Terracidiphilus sp.]|nr:YtxH domain-containing protein [Terracidiphilus sp.]